MFEGFSTESSRIHWRHVHDRVTDGEFATEMTLGARIDYERSCYIQDSCHENPLISDYRYNLEAFFTHGGRAIDFGGPGGGTVRKKSIRIERNEWDNGYPVTVQHGFATNQPQLNNRVEVVTFGHKYYSLSSTNPLDDCGEECVAEVQYWTASPTNIAPWGILSNVAEYPLQMYQVVPISGSPKLPILPPEPNAPPFAGPQAWHICLGDVPGTPCEVSTPTTSCNAETLGDLWPDTSSGPWKCLFVKFACFDRPQHRADPPPEIGLFTLGPGIEGSNCGSCSKVKVGIGLPEDLAAAMATYQDQWDCDDDMEFLLAPAGGWDYELRIQADISSESEGAGPNIVERYVPWDFDGLANKKCWGAPGNQYTWARIELKYTPTNCN